MIELRDRAGLTLRELSERAHYDYTTLSRATSGTKLPTQAVFEKFVRGCGVCDDELEVWLGRWHTTRRLILTSTVSHTPSADTAGARSSEAARASGDPHAGRVEPAGTDATDTVDATHGAAGAGSAARAVETAAAVEPVVGRGQAGSATGTADRSHHRRAAVVVPAQRGGDRPRAEVKDPQQLESLEELGAQLRLLARPATGGRVPLRSGAPVLVRIMLLGSTAAELAPVLGHSPEKITALANAAPTDEQWKDGRDAIMDFAYEAGQPFVVAFEWGEAYTRLRSWRPDPTKVQNLTHLRALIAEGKELASLSYGDIARAAHGKLGRSTAHLIVTGQRTPQAEQVELLLSICGLDVDQRWREAIDRTLHPPVRQRVVIGDIRGSRVGGVATPPRGTPAQVPTSSGTDTSTGRGQLVPPRRPPTEADPDDTGRTETSEPEPELGAPQPVPPQPVPPRLVAMHRHLVPPRHVERRLPPPPTNLAPHAIARRPSRAVPPPPAAWIRLSSRTRPTIRRLVRPAAPWRTGTVTLAVLGLLVLIGFHIAAAVWVIGTPATGGEADLATAALPLLPHDPTHPPSLVWPGDRFGAYQIGVLAGLLPTATTGLLLPGGGLLPAGLSAVVATRWTCLGMGLLTAVLLWPVQRRLGIGRLASAVGVAAAGVLPPVLAVHAGVNTATPAALWLTLAAVAAINRTSRIRVAVAVVLAVLTAPLAGALAFGFAAHNFLDRSAGRGLPPPARTAVGMALAAIALGVTGVAALGGPITKADNPPVPVPVVAAAAVIGAVLVYIGWRYIPWTRPACYPAAALVTLLVVPGPASATAAVLVIPVLAFLTGVTHHHITTRMRGRSY